MFLDIFTFIITSGKFQDSDEDAIITMVKTPFSEESISKVLSADTTLQQEFSNDVYGQYEALTKPLNNTICTQVIKPATEKHILKYTHQKPFLIYETSHNYENITKPYLDKQSFSIQVSLFICYYNIIKIQPNKRHSLCNRIMMAIFP